MKISTNVIIQVLAIVVDQAGQLSGLVPEKYKHWGVLAVGVLQALVGFLAHYRNPDGTPSATPYIANEKITVVEK